METSQVLGTPQRLLSRVPWFWPSHRRGAEDMPQRGGLPGFQSAEGRGGGGGGLEGAL